MIEEFIKSTDIFGQFLGYINVLYIYMYICVYIYVYKILSDKGTSKMNQTPNM